MAKLQPVFFVDKPDFRDPSLYTDLIAEFKRGPMARRPYVLLGGLTKDVTDTNQERWRPMLHAMYACAPGALASDLQRYLHRMIIVDYYFPDEAKIPRGYEKEGLRVTAGWIADYKSDDGRAKRADLMNVILSAKGESGTIWEQKQKITGLEQKVKELEAKNQLKKTKEAA